MKRSTFNTGDHALYTILTTDSTKQIVSVVVKHCSYFCPEFIKEDGELQFEQSFYTVCLDGDILPTNPNFDHCQPIHKVRLDQLRSYEVSADYVMNKGLWDLKVAMLEATQKATETTKKHNAAMGRLTSYGSIKPGSRIVWYEGDSYKALSATVTKIDIVAGYCLVDGDYYVKLDHNICRWDV